MQQAGKTTPLQPMGHVLPNPGDAPGTKKPVIAKINAAYEVITPRATTPLPAAGGLKDRGIDLFSDEDDALPLEEDENFDELLPDDELDNPYDYMDDSGEAVQKKETSPQPTGSQQKTEFQDTTVKAKETGKGLLTRIVGGITRIATSSTKSELIKGDTKLIKDTKDPQMLSLVELVKNKFHQSKEDLTKFLEGKLPDYLAEQKETILDQIEINIPYGLANLIKLLKSTNGDPPNGDNSLLLVNALSLLCQRVDVCLSQEKLKEIQEKFSQEQEKELRDLSKKLFPDLEIKPELQKLIDEYICSNNEVRKNEIHNQLLALSKAKDHDANDTWASFFRSLKLMSSKHSSLQELFGLVADDLLECFFPNNSIKSNIMGLATLFPKIYRDKIKPALVEVLITLFKPLENDFSEMEIWEQNLIGHPIEAKDLLKIKADLIAEDKVRISEKCKDPLMLEFVDFLSEQLVKGLNPVIDENLPPEFKKQKGLINDIIEINIVRGFANLMQLVDEADIPNALNQPPLVNLFSFLCHKGRKHINQKSLEGIQKRAAQMQAEFTRLAKKLLPDLETNPQQRALIDEYIQSDNQLSKKEILQKIISEFAKIEGENEQEERERVEDTTSFTRCLHALNQQHLDVELKELFGLFADDLLECLFPNKRMIIPIPALSRFSPLIYSGVVKKLLVDFLVTSYKPMAKNHSRQDNWEKTLKGHMGVEDLDTILEAPAALGLGLIKNFIQTNTQAVALVADKLSSMGLPSDKPESADKPKALTEAQKRKKLNAQLAQFQLANWIVEAVQGLLHTEDKQLIALGKYFYALFKDLTLGALAQGTALVIPEGEQVDEHRFVEQLLDRMIAQFIALKGEEIDSKQFWKDFLKGLNLPPITQDKIVNGFLANNTNEFKKMLDKTYPEIEKLEKETLEIINGYKNGDQLLSLIEQISGWLIKKVLKKNIDLIGMLGLEDTFEKLLDEFLPGITIDEKLKGWVKNNLTALNGGEERLSSRTVDLSKQVIQAILGKAMINTIETNFKNDSDAYAAQLLASIHKAFGNAFKDFNEEERKKITKAISLKDQIQANEEKIAVMNKELLKKPKKLEDSEQEVIDGMVLANTRYLRALNYVDVLKKKLIDCVSVLKPFSQDFSWKIDYLSYVSKGLRKCREQAETLKNPEKAQQFRLQLEAEIEALSKKALIKKALNEDEEYAKAQCKLAELKIFQTLLTIDSTELQLIRDALSTQDTLLHAEKELEKMTNEHENAKRLLEETDDGDILNRERWEAALVWIDETNKIQKNVYKLVKKNDVLRKELDQHLGVFQELSRELMVLLGLKTKQKLELPTLLSDIVWPHIQKVTEELFPRFLFNHITNVILPVLDLEESRKRLMELSGNNEFFLTFAKNAAEEFIGRIPEFVTSYKPFAESILKVMGVKEPAEPQAIERMEQALKGAMIHLGRKDVAGSMLSPYLKDAVASYLASRLKGIVPEGQEKSLAESVAKLVGNNNFTKFSQEHIVPILSEDSEEQKSDEIVGAAKEFADELNLFLTTLSDSLAKLTAQPDFNEFTKELIIPLLTDNEEKLNSKEKKRLGNQADKLAKDLNHFLLNRGKGKITNKELLETYRKQMQPDQPEIKAAAEEGVLKDLQDKKLVQKIQTVLITPEQIAENLNDFIPGAEDLHLLVAPQFQEVIVGKDEAFVENRGLLKEYIEGMFIRIFIKILGGNKEENASIYVVVARKLQEMKPNDAAFIGKKPEEVARSIIDKALGEIFNLHSSRDFKGIPLPLQKFAYEKTREMAYQTLTPVLLPLVELEAKRKTLKDLSGSTFLGSLSTAIAKDIFKELPKIFNSYRLIAAETYKLLDGSELDDEELDEWTGKIVDMRNNSDKQPLTYQLIIDAYAEVAQVELSKEERITLKAKLKEQRVLEDIRTIIFSPEQCADFLQKKYPTVINRELRDALVKELQYIVHNNPACFNRATTLLRGCVEGVIVQLFLRIAKQNPPENGKDSFLVMIENILDLTAEKLEAAKTNPAGTVITKFNDDFFKEILGITSADSFDGLLPELKPIVYEAIKDKISNYLDPIQKSLEALNNTSEEVIETKAKMKKFGMGPDGVKSNVEILSEDLANLTITSTVQYREMRGDKSYGVNVISGLIESTLEEFAHKKYEVAQLLLNYPKMAKFEERIGDDVKSLVDPEKHSKSKEKAVELISNWIGVPVNRLLEHTVGLEAVDGVNFDRNLIKNVLGVVKDHIKTLNQAKEIAGKNGKTAIQYEDFIAAAGDKLHPAVSKKGVDYQRTIDLIFERLDLDDASTAKLRESQKEIRSILIRMVDEENTGKKNLSTKAIIAEIDRMMIGATGGGLTQEMRESLAETNEKGVSLKKLIREEARAPHAQRKKEFYSPEARRFLTVLFPNGKEDLTYVATEQRGTVWKLYKEKLFPMLLTVLTDLLFDPKTIGDMLLNSLMTLRDTFKQDYVISQGEPAGLPLDPLDEVSGELIEEMLKLIELPERIKGWLVDSKTGKISPAMKKSLGASLRSQFNGTFIQRKVVQGLATLVKRNEKNGYKMQYDTRPKAEKDKESLGKALELNKNLQQVTREVLTTCTSYFIQRTWILAQARFDQLVEKAFGKIGAELKRALDMVFRFIFIRFIGSILSWLYTPLKPLEPWVQNKIQEKIYGWVSLDKNIETIIDIFKKAPREDGLTDGQVSYYEDVVFKMVGAMHQTIDEAAVH